jgi:hypothetical protein
MRCNSYFACLHAFFIYSLFFQNIHADATRPSTPIQALQFGPTSATSQVWMATAEENVNRPSFMVANTVTMKCYGQLGTSYPSTIFVRTSRSNIWWGCSWLGRTRWRQIRNFIHNCALCGQTTCCNAVGVKSLGTLHTRATFLLFAHCAKI